MTIVTGFIVGVSSNKFEVFAKNNRRKNTKLWNCCTDNIKSIKEIHVYHQKNQMYNEFSEKNKDMINNENSTVFYKYRVEMLNSIFFIVILSIMLFVGGYLTTIGKASIGSILSIITYNTLLSSPVQNILITYQDMFKANASLERSRKISLNNSNIKTESIVSTPVALNVVEFKNVSFSYNDTSKTIDNISFSVVNGESCALVGPTGSGKSTILKILVDLYDIDSGNISCIMSAENTHKDISMAFQDTYLFNKSVKENLIFSNRETLDEELNKAIDTVCLRTVITSLDYGLDTKIGENGVLLSGGERQRVGVARALLRNSKILLLDEATSALDNETEKKMMENIRRNYPDLTLIVVAHRLTSIDNFDHIIVVNEGKIIEEGNHEELMKNHMLYQKLYTTYSVDEVKV
jgi:ABC-type multidrug transport system fused ATPase/permease subunit